MKFDIPSEDLPFSAENSPRSVEFVDPAEAYFAIGCLRAVAASIEYGDHPAVHEVDGAAALSVQKLHEACATRLSRLAEDSGRLSRTVLAEVGIATGRAVISSQDPTVAATVWMAVDAIRRPEIRQHFPQDEIDLLEVFSPEITEEEH